jgi:AcrR family transcriptional regulator
MTAASERGSLTRRRLLDSARELFTERGYHETPIEQVFEAAGVSRGALYHHFDNKQDLFAAVLEEVEAEVADAVSQAAAGAGTVTDALRAGCLMYLDLAFDPAVRQIALIDAPSALGWEKWRAVEARHGYALLAAAIQHEADEGRLNHELVEYRARSLLATLIELGLMISRSGDPARARALAGRALEDLLDQFSPRTTPERKGGDGSPARASGSVITQSYDAAGSS